MSVYLGKIQVAFKSNEKASLRLHAYSSGR